MEKRLGVVGIVVENPKESAEKVNQILSMFSDIIVGRMGIPYRERHTSLIAVTVDGTNEQIGALCGKLGNVSGVKAKSVLTTK